MSLSSQTARTEIHSFFALTKFQLKCEGKFSLTGLLGVVVGIAVLSEIHLVHTSSIHEVILPRLQLCFRSWQARALGITSALTCGVTENDEMLQCLPRSNLWNGTPPSIRLREGSTTLFLNFNFKQRDNPAENQEDDMILRRVEFGMQVTNQPESHCMKMFNNTAEPDSFLPGFSWD